MEARRATKTKTNLIIGMILWLICAILLIVTIIAVCESFAEKARFEAIGATVAMKITWLFIVDVIVIVASGIFGGILVSRKFSIKQELTKEESIKYVEENVTGATEIIGEAGYDMEAIEQFNVEDIVVESDSATSNTTNETVAKPTKLKIKMGNNSSTASVSAPDYSKAERKDSSETNSSERSNGFFSAGGDL